MTIHAPSGQIRPPDPTHVDHLPITQNPTEGIDKLVKSNAVIVSQPVNSTVHHFASKSPTSHRPSSEMNQEIPIRQITSPSQIIPTHQFLDDSTSPSSRKLVSQKSGEPLAGENGFPTIQSHQNRCQTMPAHRNNPFPKVSTNFDAPSSSYQQLNPTILKNSNVPNVRQNVSVNPPTSRYNAASSEPSKTNAPPPHAVKPSFASTLKSIQEQSAPRINISPAKQTTKQGYPAVIFKREDYMVKLAERCKFTLIGKFDSTMPKMEMIRRSFEAQVQLKSTVKITHFNSNHVYIDLDNQLDHDTVWFKKTIWIQGRPMNLFTWTPTFKPSQETPIAPIWVVLPELPWHLYYMEVISELFKSVGRAISLDVATFQKTRGSVAKVKLEIDVTKIRPMYFWVGYDDDENGDGYWQEAQYEDVPSYCTYCKHQGHFMDVCAKKRREDEMGKKKLEEVLLPSDSRNQTAQNQSKEVRKQPQAMSYAHHTKPLEVDAIHKGKTNAGKPPAQKLQFVPKKQVNPFGKGPNSSENTTGNENSLRKNDGQQETKSVQNVADVDMSPGTALNDNQVKFKGIQQARDTNVGNVAQVGVQLPVTRISGNIAQELSCKNVFDALVDLEDVNHAISEPLRRIGRDAIEQNAVAVNGVSEKQGKMPVAYAAVNDTPSQEVVCSSAVMTGSTAKKGSNASANAITGYSPIDQQAILLPEPVLNKLQKGGCTVPMPVMPVMQKDTGTVPVMPVTAAALSCSDVIPVTVPSLATGNMQKLIKNQATSNTQIADMIVSGAPPIVALEDIVTEKQMHTDGDVQNAIAVTSTGNVHLFVSDSAQDAGQSHFSQPVNPCATKDWILKSFYGSKDRNEENELTVTLQDARNNIDNKYTNHAGTGTKSEQLHSTTTGAKLGKNPSTTGGKNKKNGGKKARKSVQQTEEDILKANKMAFWDAILAKSYSEKPVIESNTEPLSVQENKATVSIPSQDDFDPANIMPMGSDNDETESNMPLTEYVSPANSGNTLIPTATLEVMCKQASKVMKEVGRGFYPVTPQDRIDTEAQEAPTYYLGDLFEDSQKDKNKPSKDVKSKWNVDAPLFIPNALRPQKTHVPVESVDSQDAAAQEFPTGPSDEVLLQSLDLHDIRGLLLRQNSPPHDLPQKFSSPHPGIIEDGSEYEDEDEESTAHNKMAEARYAGLSPRVEQACKPKLIKKKRRPLELKKKEAAPKKPKRVQPTRSSKSRSSRRK